MSEIYRFGKPGEWAFDAQKKFIKLRYRLLPYIYSMAGDAAHNAGTMMRGVLHIGAESEYAACLDVKRHDVDRGGTQHAAAAVMHLVGPEIVPLDTFGKIGDRKGSYKGMLADRNFRIVLVDGKTAGADAPASTTAGPGHRGRYGQYLGP